MRVFFLEKKKLNRGIEKIGYIGLKFDMIISHFRRRLGLSKIPPKSNYRQHLIAP